jgi:acetylornithine deacetylase/succinyl-diaminopimelate desuccinylase-like protein
VSKKHHLCGSPTCTVTLISGGIKDNMIPDRCEITVDRRMIPGETEEVVVREVEATLAKARQRDPDLKVAIDRLLPTTGAPSEVPGDDPLVQAARRAVVRVLGQEPEMRGRSGACDMTHFRSIGASALITGPGSGSLAHKPDEYIEVRELVRGAQVYVGIALELIGAESL